MNTHNNNGDVSTTCLKRKQVEENTNYNLINNNNNAINNNNNSNNDNDIDMTPRKEQRLNYNNSNSNNEITKEEGEEITLPSYVIKYIVRLCWESIDRQVRKDLDEKIFELQWGSIVNWRLTIGYVNWTLHKYIAEELNTHIYFDRDWQAHDIDIDSPYSLIRNIQTFDVFDGSGGFAILQPFKPTTYNRVFNRVRRLRMMSSCCHYDFGGKAFLDQWQYNLLFINPALITHIEVDFNDSQFGSHLKQCVNLKYFECTTAGYLYDQFYPPNLEHLVLTIGYESYPTQWENCFNAISKLKNLSVLCLSVMYRKGMIRPKQLKQKTKEALEPLLKSFTPSSSSPYTLNNSSNNTNTNNNSSKLTLNVTYHQVSFKDEYLIEYSNGVRVDRVLSSKKVFTLSD